MRTGLVILLKKKEMQIILLQLILLYVFKANAMRIFQRKGRLRQKLQLWSGKQIIMVMLGKKRS